MPKQYVKSALLYILIEEEIFKSKPLLLLPFFYFPQEKCLKETSDIVIAKYSSLR